MEATVMGFSDLFKPKWKHSESIVRQEAVKALDTRSQIAELREGAQK